MGYLALVIALILIGIVVYRVVQDRRYLHEPTRKALSSKLKRNIEKEDAVQIRNNSKFKDALERARRRLSN